MHYGIARAFQNMRLFPRLSVLDNVKVGRQCRTRAGLVGIFLGLGRAAVEERRTEEKAMAAPRFVGLSARAGDLPGDLPYGQRRLVEVARALVSEPRLLLLDEPSLGLAPALVDQVFEVIEAIRARDTTLLLVEQNASMALSVADRGYVLELGRIVLTGTATELADSELIRRFYLGTGAEAL